MVQACFIEKLRLINEISCFFDKIVLSVFIDMNVFLISSTQFFSCFVDNFFMDNSIVILQQACPGDEHRNKDNIEENVGVNQGQSTKQSK